MKVFIPSTKKNPKTGKGFFCQRLAKSMSELGIDLVSDKTPHDVSLHLVKLVKSSSKKRVVRLDGVYHDTGLDYKSRNKILKTNLHASGAVVYQSKFSKSICDKYLGKFRGPKTIIHNGADVDFYKSIPPIEKDCDHLFFTSSRWRPHKRLKDIIRSFLLADVKNSKLYVAGNLKRAGMRASHPLFADKRINYLGVLNQKQSAAYLKAADAFVHLCWFDNCPNGVVEAIAAGTPVITNNVGGTHEIVRPSGGIVCNVDRAYDLSPVRLYKPPAIDQSLVAGAMVECSVNRPKISSDHIRIEYIARKYIKFFGEII